jgi:GDP-4-dehydro-6-deoxy-D-mannose reductase
LSGPIFVTGGGGFAGRHLLDLLALRGLPAIAPGREELELLDADATRAAVRRARPSAIVHLAALPSVAHAWEAPGEVLTQNVATTLHLLEASRHEAPEAAVLLAGSGEIYGAPESLPIGEDAPLRPQNPYAVSKAACDLLGGQYADAHGMRVVRTRAFNHAGPGQSDEYLVGTLARQVAEAEAAGEKALVLRVGNVAARRDFTDVRDVARAYLAAVELPAGAYNVCSGSSASVAEIIDLLRAGTPVEVGYEVDPERLRPHEVEEIRGSAERLRARTGWRPEIPLERTVADAVAGWRERLAA